jgi:hypothetical protein
MVTVKDMLNELNQLVQNDPKAIDFKICLKGNGYPADVSVLHSIEIADTETYDKTHILDCYIEEDKFIYLTL